MNVLSSPAPFWELHRSDSTLQVLLSCRRAWHFAISVLLVLAAIIFLLEQLPAKGRSERFLKIAEGLCLVCGGAFGWQLWRSWHHEAAAGRRLLEMDSQRLVLPRASREIAFEPRQWNWRQDSDRFILAFHADGQPAEEFPLGSLTPEFAASLASALEARGVAGA